MSESVIPVVLSGGSGIRLWPLSTPEKPKQFLELFQKSLFRQAIERIPGDPIVVTGENHIGLVSHAISDAGMGATRVIIEPQGRNTAPAVIAAALVADPDDVLVILAADHLIADADGFNQAVSTAVSLARAGHLVTFGVTPDRPETGYGYIAPGEAVEGGFQVLRFAEKPDRETAVRMVSDGYLWNSGSFVFRVSDVLFAAQTHCPEIVVGVKAALQGSKPPQYRLGPTFADIESISIDYAVMEHAENVAVVPIDVGWSDVGSFESLWAVSKSDGRGNVVSGDVTLVDVEGSYVFSSGRPVAVAGLSDVVVVETEDGMLVVPKHQAQLVKDLVNRMKARDE